MEGVVAGAPVNKINTLLAQRSAFSPLLPLRGLILPLIIFSRRPPTFSARMSDQSPERTSAERETEKRNLDGSSPEKGASDYYVLEASPDDLFEDGSIDPIYLAKSRVLNRAVQEIGMGKYQVSLDRLPSPSHLSKY